MSQFNFPRRHATGNESFSACTRFNIELDPEESNRLQNSAVNADEMGAGRFPLQNVSSYRGKSKNKQAGAVNRARQLIMMLKQRIKHFENTKIFSENKHQTGPIFPAINALFINFVFQNKHQRLCVMGSLRSLPSSVVHLLLFNHISPSLHLSLRDSLKCFVNSLKYSFCTRSVDNSKSISLFPGLQEANGSR